MQCLINECIVSSDAHPSFKHTYNWSKAGKKK
jgi:hypothetical protein